MEFSLIKAGKCTIEDLVELNEKKGYEFIIEDGKVTDYIDAQN